MAVIFHTFVHCIFFFFFFLEGVGAGGGGCRTQLRLKFWQNPSKFVSNDSQIIATYTEVLKYSVKFNTPEKYYIESYDP